MKKAVFLLSLTICFAPGLGAQSTGSSHQITAGIRLPAGVFAESHIGGLGAGYSWSNQRFGQLSVLSKKIIGFAATGGVDYYIGKKITEAGYDFRYGNYVYLHAFAGMIYNPGKKTNILLSAGPTAGLYKGNIDAGYGARIDGSYFLTDKIALSPGLMYMKHALVNTMWAVSVTGRLNLD